MLMQMDSLGEVTHIGYNDEFYVEFYATKKTATADGVRIRIDMVKITDREQPLATNLCDHPLYSSLLRYIERVKEKERNKS